MQRTIRVLHVDDEPDFAALTADCLEQADDRIEVVTETTVADALERLDGEEIDCIISDFDMPGQSGIEFLETVRETDPTLPFILFTGKGSEEVASDAISAGVTQYLQKETGIDQYTVLANQITNTVGKYRMEQELSEKTQLLGTVSDNVPIILCTLDTTGTFTRLQGRALDGLDLDPAEAVGRSVSELFADQPELVAHYERAVDGEHTEGVIEIGDTVFQSWFQPLRSEDGEITGVSGLAIDITERRERQQRLKRQNDLFAKSQDIADVAAWEYDLATEELRLTDHLFRMLGRDPGEAVPMRESLGFFHPEDRDRVREAFERAITEGESWDIEARLITDDDEHRWVRTRGDPQTVDGEVVRVRGTIQDITERKQQEVELKRQNEQLEEFAEIVSHDLRNPLQVAKGYLEQAELTGDPEAFEKTSQAHDRIETLIEDVLTLARQGQSLGETTTVDLGEIARDAWETVDTKEMTLSVEGTCELEAEPGRLRTLFENLFRNAAEHAGHDVTVTVGPIEPMYATTRASEEQPSGFFVSDTGPGIPADKRDEVFKSGFSTASDGTGFGLAIVARIAEAHRWDAAVSDRSYGGARFEFTDKLG